LTKTTKGIGYSEVAVMSEFAQSAHHWKGGECERNHPN